MYKPSGQLTNYWRTCPGGNFELNCYQNMTVTTSMLADESVTEAKADPDDIVLMRQPQTITGAKRFTQTVDVDVDVEVGRDVIVTNDILAGGSVNAVGDVTANGNIHTDGNVTANGNIVAGDRVYQGAGILVPPGVVMPYAGVSAPTGYLMCDGSAVSRTTYGDLFTGIGTTYGVGDGSTTFNLPNLNGRVVAGVSGSSPHAAVGDTGGSQTVALTTDELPAHSHTATTESAGTHTHTSNATGGSIGLITSTGNNTMDADVNSTPGEPDLYASLPELSINAAGAHTHTVNVGTTGSGAAFSVLDPFLTMSYIIKT